MIQITPQMRIFLAYECPDFRRGIDGLAAVCRDVLIEDPFSGSLFIFRSKKGTSVKLLMYDGQGFWIAQKRMSQGKFNWWPNRGDEQSQHCRLAAHELQVLLWNGNPNATSVAPMWRPVQVRSIEQVA
jgi:transposase